jgi:hypothetical protein
VLLTHSEEWGFVFVVGWDGLAVPEVGGSAVATPRTVDKTGSVARSYDRSGAAMVEISPTADVQFFSDRKGYIRHSPHPDARRSRAVKAGMVADWLTGDIQGAGRWLFEVFEAIVGLRSGEADKPYEWSGNAWDVLITNERFEIENKFIEDLKCTMPLDDALRVMRSYWEALGEQPIRLATRQFVKTHRCPPRLPW